MNLIHHEKWIWTFVNLFCASLFLVQLFYLLPNYFSPTMTIREVGNVELKNMDFPLDIKICVNPLLNSTVLQQFGYPNIASYQMGVNSNTNLTGWGGYNNQSGAMTTAEELLRKARMDLTTNIFKSIFIRTNGRKGVEEITDQVTLDRINWLEGCHVINFTKIGERKLDGMLEFIVFFNGNEPILNKLELKFRGRSLAARRELMEHSFYHSGPDMKLGMDKFSLYMVRIKKNVFIEEDPSKNCRNYPNPDFASYCDCDQKYMREKVDEAFQGFNLIPPWLTEDLDNVTTNPVANPNSESTLGELNKLFYGIETSKCPLPCTTFTTDTKLAKIVDDSIGFSFTFQRTVEVSILGGIQFQALYRKSQYQKGILKFNEGR